VLSVSAGRNWGWGLVRCQRRRAANINNSPPDGGHVTCDIPSHRDHPRHNCPSQILGLARDCSTFSESLSHSSSLVYHLSIEQLKGFGIWSSRLSLTPYSHCCRHGIIRRSPMAELPTRAGDGRRHGKFQRSRLTQGQMFLTLCSRRQHTSSFAIFYRASISTRRARRRRSNDKSPQPFCADLMAEMNQMTKNEGALRRVAVNDEAS